MFWYLLLAHLLGDFVFQNDWMVRNRDDIRVLSLHASIHFILMFLLVGSSRLQFWPFLLLIAVIHLIQDRVKNNLTNKHPDWTKSAFIADQFLHIFVIGVVVFWMQKAVEF